MFDLYEPNRNLIKDENHYLNDQSFEEYHEYLVNVLEETIKEAKSKKSMNEHELFLRGRQQAFESLLLFLKEHN